MSATPAAPAADFLPARMLNEFVYCPRLFFYEHVDGVFVHSADTKRGAAQHERVDSGSGELPPPAEGEVRAKPPKKAPETASGNVSIPEPSSDGANAPAQESAQPISSDVIHSRSVMLGSESLGVVAKLDLVEVTVE